MIQFLPEVPMDGFVLSQFRMERGGKDVALLNQHRQAITAPKHPHPFPHPADDRRPDKDHLQRAGREFGTFT